MTFSAGTARDLVVDAPGLCRILYFLKRSPFVKAGAGALLEFDASLGRRSELIDVTLTVSQALGDVGLPWRGSRVALTLQAYDTLRDIRAVFSLHAVVAISIADPDFDVSLIVDLVAKSDIKSINSCAGSVVPNSLLHALNAVEHVDVAYCVIEDGGLDSLSRLDCLRYLRVAGVEVSPQYVVGLMSMRSLESLMLPDCMGMAGFECPVESRVQALIVSGTDVGDAEMCSVVKCGSLRTVGVAGTSVTSRFIDAISRMGLLGAAFRQCRVEIGAIDRFIEANPECTVVV